MFLIGDVLDIDDWAEGMSNAGRLIVDLRNFVGSKDLQTLKDDNEFKKKRDALQRAMSEMIKTSKMRFGEPWGMVCLYGAGGSPATAYGKLSSQKLPIERGQPSARATVAGTA